MARPARETARDRATYLLSLLLPSPGRLEFSVRLALICALTALVVELYQTPDPALTVYVAFFLIKPDRTTSIILSLVMVLVMTVTLLIILAATIVVADVPMWRVGLMTMLSFGLIFLASASKLRPITPIMALIAAYALDLLGTVQSGEVATRALLYAWLFVGIPAGVSIVVNLLGGPAPRRLAERALARRLRLAAVMLASQDQPARGEFDGMLCEGIGEILAWLKLAGVEKTASAVDLAALRQAATSTLQIMLLVDAANQIPGLCLHSATVINLTEKLNAIAAILTAGTYPIEIEPLPAEPKVSPEAASWLAEVQDTIAQFARPPETMPAPVKKPSTGFLVADAFTNPTHVRHALKTTGAAMFCYVLYSLLDWPTIHTCLITCYIVSLGTAAETVEKLSLRVLGCMVGAAIGIAAIVFLIPDMTSIGSLMIVIFLTALASAWVAGGDVRISYAGFQIAFAIFLCVLQGSGPSFDMVTARDRVIGILLGNMVTYLVFTNIWPVSVTARIDPGIVALLRQWSAVFRANGQATFLAMSQAFPMINMLEHDLDLVAYEPRSMRPSWEWLAGRRQATAKLASSAGIFWLCLREDPSLSSEISGRLDHIAAALGGTDGAALPVVREHVALSPARIENPRSSVALRNIAEGDLREIENLLDVQSGRHLVLTHASI